MAAVQLGFAEPFEKDAVFTIDEFPNKIGGKPLWLNPDHLLAADDVTCGICGKVMVLLTQFYTPEDDPPEAFHRTMYVFVCRDGKCHGQNWKQCIKAFRSQLPEDIPHFDASSPPERLLSDTRAPQCRVCGLLGSKVCSRCKLVQYCSREHQLDDWTQGKHKQYCSNSAESAVGGVSALLFPESELVSENEPEAPIVYDIETVAAQLQEQLKVNEQVAASLVEDDAEETEVEVDKAFLKFQKRVEREPEQVVRYARVAYDDDSTKVEPLWASDSGIPQPSDLPACPHCGKDRTFEFQIMPQLLTHLKIDHYARDALDWGTILVYSCSSNCQPTDDAGQPLPYMQEVVWRQLFSEQGMGDSAKKALEEAHAREILQRQTAPAVEGGADHEAR
ncbi:Programmed cell death protein 2 [Gaertneriomyces sp. JEL0708]|nr:Programmed cell death protein 2 [Gaertneriomyces sp. JEL0708]